MFRLKVSSGHRLLNPAHNYFSREYSEYYYDTNTTKWYTNMYCYWYRETCMWHINIKQLYSVDV